MRCLILSMLAYLLLGLILLLLADVFEDIKSASESSSQCR